MSPPAKPTGARSLASSWCVSLPSLLLRSCVESCHCRRDRLALVLWLLPGLHLAAEIFTCRVLAAENSRVIAAEVSSSRGLAAHADKSSVIAAEKSGGSAAEMSRVLAGEIDMPKLTRCTHDINSTP